MEHWSECNQLCFDHASALMVIQHSYDKGVAFNNHDAIIRIFSY